MSFLSQDQLQEQCSTKTADEDAHQASVDRSAIKPRGAGHPSSRTKRSGDDSPDAQNHIPGKVFLAFVASGLLSLSGVVVETATNIIFPTLMHEFHISTDTVQWMTTIYLLVVSVVVPLSVTLKARFTSKSLFVTANLCFLTGLIIDIVASNFALLLAGRALQGFGAGIALPLMFNIILEEVPPEKIGMMMGCGTLITAIAPAIGPTFGGVVVSSVGWRYIFVLLVPIILVSLVMGVYGIEQLGEVSDVPFDVLGIGLIILTFAGLIIGFGSMSSARFMSLKVAGALVVGFVALALFVMRQLRVDAPMLDVRLLRDRCLSGYMIAFFLFQCAMLGLDLVLPNYIQLVNHSSALVAGLCLLPGALLGAVFAPLSGRILDVFGPKPPLLAGPLLSLAAMASLLVLNGRLSDGAICWLYVLYMLGMGLSSGNIMTTGLQRLDGSARTMGNSFFNTAQQFAGAVGTSLSATLLAAGQAGASELSSGTVRGASFAFIVLIVVLGVQYLDLIRTVFRTN
ncbi:DHA2 family efflux MFS transporter permease subunit [Bifidobacterium bombi]|uniref:EmrB/QacA family drug resistance transporter n=1 Tax=Bifidobacterium bombi DSM 19703 TaxID=1341695 RepID=A0A086BNM9_9BIFI|nr:DHA2 family efflux MFS transporter permease subunit [Bifidobacterium bombi]KFF30543.1 EmrB/QacA family drug resistance transporter [Bifidobacterium bombi DSM 19703]